MTNRPNSSLLFALMALLTLGMVIVLPVINRPVPLSAPDTAPADAPRAMDRLALDRTRSALVFVEGGTFTRGTSSLELGRSVQLCLDTQAASGTSRDACTTAMGADSLPAHPVTLDGFWMETTEVTYGQYIHFLNTLGPRGHLNGCDGQFCIETQQEDPTSPIAFNGTTYSTSNPAIDDFPVVNVTWYGAAAYCAALSRRLPTEAEWEFAARGPQGTLYPWGSEWTYTAANVRGSLTDGGATIAGPQPVGGHGDFASRDGIRDLAGNAAEWVADWYAADFYAQPDARLNNPTGPADGLLRVVRGGSWDDLPFFARSVQRHAADPASHDARIGFRCVTDQ